MQASLLHSRPSLSDPNYYSPNSQQLRLICDTRQQGSIPDSQVSNLRQVNSMAQPSLQYQQGGHPHGQQWHRPQALRQPTTNPYTACTSNDLAYQQGDLWGTDSIQNQGFASNSALQLPPHIVSAPSGELMYPGTVSQELAGKGSSVYGNRLTWFPHRPAELRYDTSGNGSDPDTNSSYSPKSYVSETQCSQMSPFTPEPVANAADWGCYTAPSYTSAKVSSPKDIVGEFKDAAILDFTGLPQYGTASSPTPAGMFNGLRMAYGVPRQYNYEISNSQENSPETSPWFPDGQSLGLTGCMPYRTREYQINSAPVNSAPIDNAPIDGRPIDDRPNEHRTYSENYQINTSREEAVWDRSQERFQDHFPSQQAQDTRKADDAILLRGKRDGLTYKEISKKMHIKCAESTLRGRYRALTKARQDRVRKPVWRERDLELLTKFTMQDLDRIESNHHNSLSYSQKLAKVQWKKIAEAIRTNGGSYHFGNSTCKRKWLEIHPTP